jgi:hypothetical protein
VAGLLRPGVFLAGSQDGFGLVRGPAVRAQCLDQIIELASGGVVRTDPTRAAGFIRMPRLAGSKALEKLRRVSNLLQSVIIDTREDYVSGATGARKPYKSRSDNDPE